MRYGELTKSGARADDKKKILFVCTANICCSPMAEAMFNALSEERGLTWRLLAPALRR